MAIGNLGAVQNLLQGYAASGFSKVRSNQGLSLLPWMVTQIASRAELTYTNLRVSAPMVNAAAEIVLESGAVGLIALVIDNAEAANATTVYAYPSATVTEGGQLFSAGVLVAAGQMHVAVFPEPIPMAALSLQAIQSDSAVNQEAGTVSTAGAVTILAVYAE